MPLFWICGSWFPLSLLKCGGGRGGWEAAVLLVVHLLRQTGSDDALRSAPPANSARPGAPKVVSSKTLLRFEISPGCVFACCAALVPGFIAVFKGESAHFYAEWGIHAKTLRINLSFIVASEDITPGLGGGVWAIINVSLWVPVDDIQMFLTFQLDRRSVAVMDRGGRGAAEMTK